MTLADAVAQFEGLFSAVEETTVYADDIAAVLTGGVKSEGGCSPALCTSEDDAVRLWLAAAKEYKAIHKGDRLVWRVRPDPSSHTFYQHSFASSQQGALEPITLYRVYSRFAIRSKIDHMAAVRDFVRT